MAEDPATTRFREYLRIDSSQPNPDYDRCVEWLSRQAEEIGLEFHKVDFPDPDLFTVWLTWRGSNPALKSIMLNSHIDVVPVDPTKWNHDPFAGFKDADGNIIARGAQDRKSLGCQYLEAIRRLKAKGFVPLRTVHVTFVPDEEVGGTRGMKPFVKSKEFQDLNIGLELDEGGATLGDDYWVFYGERNIWQFKVTAVGKAGHSAFMYKDNAGHKLNRVITRLMQFRDEQMARLEADSTLTAGDVNSVNLSQLGGGLQPNVTPSELWAVFDMRLKLEEGWQFADAEKMLRDICTEAGPGVSIQFIRKLEIQAVTALDDTNVWWKTFKALFDEMGWKLSPHFFQGGTDARYIREAGYPALGFAPLPHTVPMGHQDNESIKEDIFLWGIKVYELLIPRLVNVPPEQSP